MRRRKRPDLLILVGLIVLGFILGRFQSNARGSGSTDLFSRAVRGAVTPTANGFNAAASFLSDVVSGLGRSYSLLQENRRLKQLAAAGETYTADVERLLAQIEQLRKMGGWMSTGRREKIPADVTGFFPHENRLTINAGTAQGVKRGMPVATYEGLVGRVETVDANSAQVLLITAPSNTSRLSAIVQRAAPNPPPAGLIRGESANMLTLELADPTATVEPGDMVVTSGFSEQIPRGIPIGKIVSVQDDPSFGKRTAVIFPRVPLGSLREVVVVK